MTLLARSRRSRPWWGAIVLTVFAAAVAVLVPWAPGTARTAAVEAPPHARSGPADQRETTQVITVTAASTRATMAMMQRWERRGDTWQRVGRPVRADVGTQGLTAHPSEQVAATPLGTFTLTQAFGGPSNAGRRVTRMPYRQARFGDGWGADPGNRTTYNRLYNCDCADGELYRLRDSYFRYGLVIDYNRRPVVPGAGSGFFVHVGDGHPTAGCVGLPAGELARVLAWLDPAAHPQIVIAVTRGGQAAPPVAVR